MRPRGSRLEVYKAVNYDVGVADSRRETYTFELHTTNSNMSLPIFEVAKSVASDAYKQDPSAINPLFELVLRQPGALG